MHRETKYDFIINRKSFLGVYNTGYVPKNNYKDKLVCMIVRYEIYIIKEGFKSTNP